MILRTHIFVACLFMFWTSAAYSASVSAVKGQKVLINLEGDTTSEGDEFYLLNPANNKKTAIIRIKQVKGSKALGEILKGRAAQGYALQAKAASKMSADVPASETSEEESAPVSRNDMSYLRVVKDSYGITGSYIMNSMNADVSYKDGFGISHKTSTSMSGSGFGVGGFYDYAFGQALVGRGSAAIEQFNVSGNASEAACSGSTSCDAKINYLSLYGLLKWYPIQGKYRGWVGGGMGYMLAVSKSSTALNESQISTNQVFTFALGTDIQMSRKNYIPVSIEYNLFPASDTVKANMILIKGGWAWNL
ncbi:hypothetical protein [uncultured Bdellovibrio sp.]|uniref:hypothetical protein n=1 Tax=Bdellovibrio sp. HCB-162 TaxID=3394234 RepID=UPI0025E739BC|nr:hypothetical protein [uncultured Bdellovibrio sp.]